VVVVVVVAVVATMQHGRKEESLFAPGLAKGPRFGKTDCGSLLFLPRALIFTPSSPARCKNKVLVVLAMEWSAFVCVGLTRRERERGGGALA
jgi:hypothetical protein